MNIELDHEGDIRVQLGVRLSMQSGEQQLHILPAVEDIVAAFGTDESIGKELRNFGATTEVVNDHGVIESVLPMDRTQA